MEPCHRGYLCLVSLQICLGLLQLCRETGEVAWQILQLLVEYSKLPRVSLHPSQSMPG